MLAKSTVLCSYAACITCPRNTTVWTMHTYCEVGRGELCQRNVTEKQKLDPPPPAPRHATGELHRPSGGHFKA